MVEIYLLVILLTLILSAFFSGVEIAFVSANKLKMELTKKENTISGKILKRLTANSDQLLATLLIGNNIALVILGFCSAKLFEEYLLPNMNDVWLLLIQTLITTAVVLIGGEFLPKSLFRLRAEGVLKVMALPIQLIYYILYIPALLVNWLTKAMLTYVFKVDGRPPKHVFSKVDLEHFIKQYITEEDEDDELNTDIFEKALTLTEVKARECMVPRTEIESIDVNADIKELRAKFIDTKLSKIIVYEDNIDNVLGYVHHFDLLKKPQFIQQLIFPTSVIPESMPAKDILNLFTKNRKTIALVVDEFGGTAGIVTLEDVLEEIFGEIQDEHDDEEFVDQQLSENEYIFSGRLEVDFLEEKYQLTFPEGEYETLAGFIVVFHESIPDIGEEIEIDKYKLTILNTTDTRIETVKLTVLNNEND